MPICAATGMLADMRGLSPGWRIFLEQIKNILASI
jgi:hypothetical protein